MYKSLKAAILKKTYFYVALNQIYRLQIPEEIYVFLLESIKVS